MSCNAFPGPMIPDMTKQDATAALYAEAAATHAEGYRAGKLATPALCTDAVLALRVGVKVSRFDRQRYVEAFHDATAAARWGGIAKSHASRKEG